MNLSTRPLLAVPQILAAAVLYVGAVTSSLAEDIYLRCEGPATLASRTSPDDSEYYTAYLAFDLRLNEGNS